MFIDRIGVQAHEGSDVRWPLTIPAVLTLVAAPLALTTPVTFLVGANGSGKSTLVEGIAGAYGMDVRGGHGGRKYAAPEESSPLSASIDLSPRPPKTVVQRKAAQGYFLRAETAYGVMTYMSDMGVRGYGERHLGTVSHGESYLQVLANRFVDPGLYLLDEPEAPLSFESTLRLMVVLAELVKNGGQVICATHSPILTRLPGATILELDDSGLLATKWEDLRLVGHYRQFLDAPESYLRHLLP